MANKENEHSKLSQELTPAPPTLPKQDMKTEGSHMSQRTRRAIAGEPHGKKKRLGKETKTAGYRKHLPLPRGKTKVSLVKLFRQGVK